MPPLTPIAHVIMNRHSGLDNKDTLIGEIEAAFTTYGWKVDFILASRQNLPQRTEQAVAQAPGAIVVAGGDGTINTVASACAQAKRPLGLLPAGTFNFAARNLGVSTEVRDAVAVIVEGQVRPIDIGEINGRIFLCGAGLGLYAQILEQREHDKRRFGRNRLVAFLSGIRCLLRRQPLFAVELVADGQTQRYLTTTLFFGCNALQLEHFNAIGAAECPSHRQLAVLSLQLRNRWDVIVAAWTALMGRLDALDTANAFCASTVHVQTRHRAVKVAIDGEVVRLQSPLEVRLRRDALQVFAPAVEQS